MTDLLLGNLLSPIPLAFLLGVVARAVRSDLAVPTDVHAALSLYLLLALGLHGGVELSRTPLDAIAWPAAVTVLLGCATPLVAYAVLRRFGGFGIADAAGIAAHYGSVSAVTYIAAEQFVRARGLTAEGFMPTLLTLLESPGILVALAVGTLGLARERARLQTAAAPTVLAVATGGAPRPAGGRPLLAVAGAGRATPAAGEPPDRLHETLRELVTGRTTMLLVGGLLVGWAMGDAGWRQVSGFFDPGSPVFRGLLTLFILELGLVVGGRLGDLRRTGPFLLAFGIAMPVLLGALGVLAGHLAGLSVGGSAMLGAMVGSASYIAAPPAVRASLPEANPTYSITLALAITFPFNLLLGIPLYVQLAKQVAG